MRNILILGLGILSFVIYTSFARYVYVCEIKNLCYTEVKEQTPKRAFSLQLKNGDEPTLQNYEQLFFDKGSTSPILTPNNHAFLDKVAAYLKANPEQNLTITGLYRNSEQGMAKGMFENLGIARANALRDLLVKRGIDINRISLDHAMLPNDTLTEAARFDLFEARPATYEEEGGLVKAQFRFDDMTFSDANFEFNSDVFKPGTAFITWADSVQLYFDINEDKSLNIIGHTDNVGTMQYNEDLGLRRAQSAKRYFEEKGMEVPIKTATRGEKAPIAPNNTPIGRQKNRRVNFVIE